MPKFIFVVGGVMSSVGKGVATASIGRILQAKGFKVTAIKADPYVNVDAGTMNPLEHGEVFVTDDKDETDQDIGNYERFLNQDITSINYMTTGRVYKTVIENERNMKYEGKCVQVVPHIPEEIIRRIHEAQKKHEADITVIEIGGTVGEYENILFLEAARMMKLQNPKDVAFILVSYLPIPSKVGEMKTKPTQHAARTLSSAGIQADFILCRGERSLDEPRKKKIETFCNVPAGNAISAPDVESIYQVPINFEQENLGNKILEVLNLEARPTNFGEWQDLVNTILTVEKTLKIGVIGKYFETGNFVISDSYISVIEAIRHACWAHNVKPELEWINSEDFENDTAALKRLDEFDGIVVPGGFGTRGIEGKILAAQYARENNIPYLGLCYGMQIAAIEYARNVAGIIEATSQEMSEDGEHQVIHVMEDQREKVEQGNLGGTMRLGAWPCILKDGSVSARAYGKNEISERHRHRYEFNNKYRQQLEDAGLVIAGTSPDNTLVEIIELADHPFYVGVQFHPEFKSRPLNPHPLFKEFIKISKGE